MDRAAAWAFVALWPLVAAAIYFGTRYFPPFWGYGAGLAVYWFAVLLPLILWRGGHRRARFSVTLPSRWCLIANLLPIFGVAVTAAFAVATTSPPLWLLSVVLGAALINGTLEETFWRGTVLLDHASKADMALHLILFTGWHFALLFAAGITVTGGSIVLLAGAAGLGALWTWARVTTGSIGFVILCHVGLNIFAFTELAIKNDPQAF